MSAPLVGGTPDTAHPAVVAIVERRLQCSSAEDLACSGTLIGPRAVLTAAHCLDEARADELEVITGAWIEEPDEVIAVWSAIVHPAYDRLAAPDAQHDLAVLVLASAPPIAAAAWAETPPAELVAGASLTAAGYGATAGFPAAPSGKRLAAGSVIDELTAGAMWTTGGTACGGDSGGAVFLATADGERLVGVIKGSQTNCTDRALAVRTDAEATFVRDALAAAAATNDPGRPAIDDADACSTTCAVHEDCPLGMLCLPEDGAQHCGWRDVRIGALGEPCDDTDASCISVGQGTERECRRLSECGDDIDEDPGGCCNTGGAGELGGGLLLVVLVALMTPAARRAPPGPGRSCPPRRGRAAPPTC